MKLLVAAVHESGSGPSVISENIRSSAAVRDNEPGFVARKMLLAHVLIRCGGPSAVRTRTAAKRAFSRPLGILPAALSITHKSLTLFGSRRLKFLESFESLVIHC